MEQKSFNKKANKIVKAGFTVFITLGLAFFLVLALYGPISKFF